MKDFDQGKESDELEGKGSDKQGETCDVIETKLKLEAYLDVSLTGLSWPLFIGGQVSRSRSGSIQIHLLWRFTY
jgi:hypothetical protein